MFDKGTKISRKDVQAARRSEKKKFWHRYSLDNWHKSTPKQQFELHVKWCERDKGHLHPKISILEAVRKRWIDQEIWDNDWTDTPGERWKHEKRSTLSDLDPKNDPSTPFCQFISQVLEQRDDYMASISREYRYTKASTCISEASLVVKKRWIEWGIWDPKWGLYPGMAWMHERFKVDEQFPDRGHMDPTHKEISSLGINPPSFAQSSNMSTTSPPKVETPKRATLPRPESSPNTFKLTTELSEEPPGAARNERSQMRLQPPRSISESGESSVDTRSLSSVRDAVRRFEHRFRSSSNPDPQPAWRGRPVEVHNPSDDKQSQNREPSDN